MGNDSVACNVVFGNSLVDLVLEEAGTRNLRQWVALSRQAKQSEFYVRTL